MDMMKIEGTGNLARELRQLAADVDVRRELEESWIDRERLSNLGELILIAAGMAADLDGEPFDSAELSAEVSDGLFDDILYREWPDAGSPDGAS